MKSRKDIQNSAIRAFVTSVSGPFAFASPKSSTFTEPSGRILTLPGFEIAMHDVLLVRGFQSIGDLAREGESFFDRNGAFGDAFRQRRAFDQLHDDADYKSTRPGAVSASILSMNWNNRCASSAVFMKCGRICVSSAGNR
jgi:hypothetical protein